MTVGLGSYLPSTADDLAEFVRDAAAGGRSVRPHGGDTKRRFGNLGPDPDHAIDMGGLDQVIDYSPVDLTLAVEPGITLQAIDELLADRRQRLVLDAPERVRATIGGCFAAGLSGPRRLKYGSLKDLVVGLEVVNSAGAVTKSGGMVVKNVSGYEMARLHYGAHGAFGMVTRLNLRVQPMPESRVESLVSFEDADRCIQAAWALLTSNLDPAAVYIVRGARRTWNLHVQIEGSEAFTASQAAKIRLLSLNDGAEPDVDTVGIEGSSTPAFDEMVDLAGPEDQLVARLSAPASKQGDMLKRLVALDEAAILADAGSGLIYVRTAASEASIEKILATAPATTFLALPDGLKAGRDVFGPMDDGAAAVLRRVKREFDPRGIFNPGRFALNL